MSRRARTRTRAPAAKELSFLSAFDDTELDDIEPDPIEPDDRIPIGPTDCSCLTDAQLAAAWPFPTTFIGF